MMNYFRQLFRRGRAAEASGGAEDASTYRIGGKVRCRKCNRSISIDLPMKDSQGKIVVSTVDDMMPFAFSCQDCRFVTCARCALLAYELHNPRNGIPTCPSCGLVAIGFLREQLEAGNT